MARPVRPWFRFYVEAFSDRKLRRLRPEYRWLFAACLGAARQSPEPGVLLVSEGQPMDAHDLADYAGMDVRSVKAGMRELVRSGLIVERSSGDLQEIVWGSPTFQRRQFESDDVTKRTRKHRLSRADDDEGTFQPSSRERSGNVGGNAPETETETETEVTPADAGVSATPSRPTAKRATQRPADFQPTQAHIDLAAERGVDLTAEWAKFCDWCDANGKAYKDWSAALRNWIRNSRPGAGRAPSNVQQHLALARDLAEREQQATIHQLGGQQ